MPILQSLLVAVAVSSVAWRARALLPSGAVAATALGTLVLATTGWSGGLILMAFFLPGSAISRIWPGPSSSLDPKGDRRDGWQVLANGGAPAVALLVGGPAAILGFSAGLAAAAADTWATVVGAQSPVPPRHMLGGHIVPAGTSGGVTLLGTAGAALGAMVVAAAALPLVGGRGAVAAAAIGMAGMALDSVLGATAQGRFHCGTCDQNSERLVHRCGAPTRHVGGLRWLTNDGVNALATAAATVVGWAAWAWCCVP